MEKFEEQFKNLKNDLTKIKLDEDFKTKLKSQMYYEYNKDTKLKSNNLFMARKIFVAFACCFYIISTCVFADGIQNWFTSAFGSKDKQIETAIENGNIQYVDMDYIQCNNLSFKIDFLFYEDNDFYIAFNVLTDMDFDDILLDGLKITGDNGEVIFDEGSYTNEYDNFVSKYNKESIIKSFKNRDSIFLRISDFSKVNSKILNISLEAITLRNANEFNKKNINLNHQIIIDRNIIQ